MFYDTQAELKKVYDRLPTFCFQADLNESNILLDDNRLFAGLIDFNLSGCEPILNYAVREALWHAKYCDKAEDCFTVEETYQG